MEQHELITPGAAASRASEAAASASATTAARVPTKEEMVVIESLVEANVQRSLDSLDAWKITAPFRGEKSGREAGTSSPAVCSKDRHTCNLEAEEMSALCVGCLLYRRIVRDRSIFPVGGRADICDYMAAGIADPLIFAFIKDGGWLTPMSKLGGNWFVKHPITFQFRAQTSMVPASQVAVRRNKVRIFNAEVLLESLGLTHAKESILARLRPHWPTESGGSIYSLDDLLDFLGPITNIAQSAHKLGIALDGVPSTVKLASGVQKLIAEIAK